MVALKEGADLDLSCPIVVDNEDLIISWTCNNEPANIRSSRIHVTDSGVLRIRSAKLGDSCNYRCEAADGYGTLSMIVKVVIVDTKLVKKLAQQQQQHQNQTLATQQQQLKKTLPQGATQQRANSFIIQQQQHQHNNNDPTRPFNDHQPQAAEQQEPSLEIEIVPPVIHVKKNHTFSLECKVRHSASAAPQIIWLKEFIGRKPDSLSEAHEQNLVVIDNVYYHSLNWPRSITNWSNSANSALLVRQSNHVHSGHYICFAGYAPTIMSSRTLTFNQTQQASNDVAGINHQKRSLRYKMAIAEVQVDGSDARSQYQVSRPRNLLIGNSWIATSMVVCIFSCLILFLTKTACTYFRAQPKRFRTTDKLEPGSAPNAGDGITGESLAVKQLHSSKKMQFFSGDNSPVNYIHFGDNNNKSLADIKCNYLTAKKDSDCSQASVNSTDLVPVLRPSSETDNNNHHLYSVIDDHDKHASIGSAHYKIPKSVIQ